MNVIVFSRRMGRARQFELARPRVLMAMAIGVVLLFSIVFLAGLKLDHRSLVLEPTAQVREWSRQLEEQRSQLVNSRGELQERLDAIASRMGQMTAQVIRLEALGRRLTEMAGLDQGEFNFGEPPAQGGPEAAFEGALATAPELTVMLDRLARQIEDKERQLGVLENLISTRNLSREIVPDGRPVSQGWISSYFGNRADPFTGRTAFHRGVDFAGRSASAVVTVASGVVTWSRERFGYGKTVEINHGNGYVTRYAHNAKNLVKIGDTVKKGQTIALMGSSGRSTGPHLHFEVLKDGRAVNPISFVGR
jgi:murein DD-endopeptidase MepM/ murein hydrolase activator NlpD